MKPLQGDASSNESCSCTSCISDTDSQSLKALLAQGSRIDRLFNSKYIPLRESKLIDKLIRTRALYDSVRKELLSSSVSVSSKANLKPRKSPIVKGALEEAKKSSDIVTLVDLVDKGLGSKKLNECCSCCNCNSGARLHEHGQKGRRYRQAHVGGNITSRSSVMSRHGTGEELRSGKKYKAKNIKSDPCTCACESGELQSRVMLKKIRPEQPTPIIESKPITTTSDKHKFMMLNNERLRKSYHRLKRSKANPTQYIENMGEGGVKTIKKSKQPRGFLEAQKKKSKEQLKLARRKIKERFETDRKAVQKSKPIEGFPVENNVADNLPYIKKGSTMKLKDNVSDKRQLQDWELKQSIVRRSRKNNQAAKRFKNVLNTTPSTSNVSLPKEQNATSLKPTTKQQKMRSRKLSKKEALIEPHVEIAKKPKDAPITGGPSQLRKERENGSPLPPRGKTRSVKSMTNLPPILSTDEKPKIVPSVTPQMPFSESKAKNPIRKFSKLLKSISTSSIEKSTPVEKIPHFNARQAVNNNQLKSKYLHKELDQNNFIPNSLISNDNNKIMKLPDAPYSYEPRKPRVYKKSPLPDKPQRHEESRLPEKPQRHEESPLPEKLQRHEESPLPDKPLGVKQKHNMMKNIQAGSHALKRCLCSLKIKVKKTKSRVNKSYASECECPNISTERKRETKYKSAQTDTPKKTKSSSLSSKCDCPDIKINVKEKGHSKYKPDQTNIHNATKSTSIRASDFKWSDINAHVKDKEVNTFQPSQRKTHLETKSTSNHASDCECTHLNITTEEKPGTKYDSTQTDTPQKSKSLSHASQCDCPDTKINVKEKRPSKYKPDQANTRHATKSTSIHIPTCSHASECDLTNFNITTEEKPRTKDQSTQTDDPQKTNELKLKKTKSSNRALKCVCTITNALRKEKRGIQYHAQTDKLHASKCECPVINIITKEKRGPRFHPGYKTTRPERKSKANQLTKCECPVTNVTVKGKETLSPKQRDNDELLPSTAKSISETSKSRLSVNLFEKTYAKDKFEKLRDSRKIKNQDNMKRIHKSGVRTKHIQSQISDSTGKSKYTKKIHGLRRCFCTLKLGKLEKKNNNAEIRRKISRASPESIDKDNSQFALMNVSKSTEKNSHMRHTILPYECDPGFCVPSECKPRECKEVITKKEGKKLRKRIRTSDKNRKTRSNSSNNSLTSRSVQLPKAKKIHSILVTHRSEVPIQILKKKGIKDLPKSSMHQLRPSFNINFFKQKRPPLDSPIDTDSKIKKDIKMRPSKDDNLDYIKSLQKFTRKQNIKQEKSYLLGPTIKRCLCKLHKKHKTKIGALENMDSGFEKLGKGSKAKYPSQLKPYECEPYICVPGECDKYECLERIKERNNVRSSKDVELAKRNNIRTSKDFGIVTKNSVPSSKDFGIGTNKNKMVSKSSDTRKLGSISKVLFVNSDFKQQKSAMQQFKKMRKYSDLSHLPTNAAELYSAKSLRKGVRIGSHFSFNIEFSKDILPVKSLLKVSNNVKRNKVEDNMMKRSLTSTKRKLLSIDINARHKIKRASPMLKRCICTLKLLKNDKQYRGSKLTTPFIMKKPTQVYAVSTVTVAKTKMNSPKMLLLNEIDVGSRSVDSYNPTSYKKKALSRTRKWQYFKKESSSSVFSISSIAFKSKKMHSYIRENKRKLLQISPTDRSLLDMSSKETVRFESKFSCEFNYLKGIDSKRRHFLQSAQSQSYLLRHRKRQYLKSHETDNGSKIITDFSKLTGVQPLLRRCYCTMNIQVAGPQSSPSPKKRHYQHNRTKLKDYECEPGVCVPYECDPYECQKLIMKRLMRKVSRMSGTDRRLRTSSSLTSTMSSRSKTRKLQSSFPREHRHRVTKSRPTGLKYQTLPRPPQTQRQAVRVGSVFSFDIKFTKDTSKPTPVTEMVRVPKRPSISRSSKTSDRYRRDRGTRAFGLDRRDSESQSMMNQMRHKASSVTPMLRRCFCTLKLQKKGRQQKERELQVNQGTSTPPNYKVEKPILRTTETGQNTKNKKYDLLPYECEPNICVPGECDPYECLELIKRRRRKHTKDFGTDSMTSKITSRSSMTARPKRKRKYMQSRNLRVKSIKSKDTSVMSRPSEISIVRQTVPSRQAVRLSSSFSFNVEFYKDKSSTPYAVDRPPPETYVDKTHRQVRKVPKYVHAQNQMRESSSQDRKSTCTANSQIGIPKRGQSTMTSAFLKRCFCTAKLHGIKVDGIKTKQNFGESFSALKRCFCTLKSFNAAKKEQHRTTTTSTGNEKVAPLAQKQVVLEPYECEPGVCVPGLCDPYECEKLIAKRRAKEKMAGTTAPKTKSTSSSFTSSKTSKARMTQSKHRTRHYEKYREQSVREIAIKEKPRTPVLPQRQAVKIGSNFSFNVEFYKDLKLPDEVQPATTEFRKTRRSRDQGHSARYGPKTYDRGHDGRGIRLNSRGSQMYAARKEDKSLGPILKRCFCTLKLHKQRQDINNHVKQEKSMHQGTSTPVIREVPTLQTRSVMTTNKQKAYPYKLEPYECEPGVCVPGECDPYECEKRIKRRLMNRASMTDRHQRRSSSNMTRSRYKYRDSGAQSSMQRARQLKQQKVRRPELRSDMVARPSRQAVNIGSNFSFNIEFFKDRSSGNVMPRSRAIKQYSTYEKPRRTASRSTDRRSVSSRNKRAQHTNAVRDMDSQVLAQKMRSTMTGVGPFLKRCFCTLQLHNSINNKRPYGGISVATRTEKIKVQPNIASKNTEKATHIQKQAQFHGRKLEPYECEPGVCVPGECDPYECEKRIKRRMQSKQSNTEEHKGRSVSSSIAESTKSRPRRTQARSYSPSQRKMRTGRTDSEFRGKEPVTCDPSPNRQAVRVGSSFSFNIEFYKDKTPDLPANIPKIKCIKNDSRETETRPNITKNVSSYGRRSCRDCQSQSDCVKTDCKASCAPLLKRCFCTLKLQKMGTQQQQTKFKTEPTHKSQGTRTSMKRKAEIQPYAREIGTTTKKYAHILEPYECEPGVCVPGLCDPYECEKRIKLRNMKHFGTGTTRASMKSMSSLTSRNKGTRAMNTLTLKDKCGHKRKTSTGTFYRKPTCPSRTPDNINRQSLSLGSNFSFNVEFYKDCTSGHGGSYQDQMQSSYNPPAIKPVRCKPMTSTSTTYRTKCRAQGSNGRDRLLNHRKSQVSAKTESRASGMGPLLKRCFCTLTLQRAEVKSTLNTPAAQKKQTSTKSTSTKKKYIPTPTPAPVAVQQLDPFECEPNVCIPGECNPYECLERIKRRGIRRMSRTTGTRMKRSSQMSVSSMAAQLMPGCRAKRTQFNEETSAPQKVDRIVEEPRFPFLSGNANTRQVVRISSNFSFNIEFFKEVSPEATTVSPKPICPQKEICRAKDICTTCNKSGYTKLETRIGQHGTRKYDRRSQDSQSERVQTEDKSSAVAMLRRCFCTAKLHKTHLARSQNPKPYPSRGSKALTVGRVEEIRPLSFFGPKKYWVQYQIQQPTMCKHCEGIKNNNAINSINMGATTINNRKTDPNKLVTIMSYIPSKYNKIKSKTIVQRKNDTNFNKTCCSKCHCNRKFCRMQSRSAGKKSKNVNNSNKTCCSICQCKRKFCKMNHTVDMKTTTTMTKDTNKSTLKKMLCQCKVLFGKGKNVEKEISNLSETNKNRINQKTDVLKPSKSERRPNRAAKRGLKKSKSLKFAKVSTKDVHQNKKKYSRFQSGDCLCQGYVNNKSQNGGINFVKKNCPHCQTQFKQPIPMNKQVHFALSPNEIEKHRDNMLNTDIKHKQKKSKSISYLFKSSKYNNTEDLKCLKLCGDCGGFKTKTTLPTQEECYKQKHKSSFSCCVCSKNKTHTISSAITNGNKTSDAKKIGAKRSSAKASDAKSNDAYANDAYANDAYASGAYVSGAYAGDAKASDAKASDAKASDAKANDATIGSKIIKKRRKKQPCICGSPACKKEVERLEENRNTELMKSKRKVCVCGTTICAAETAKEARLAESGFKRVQKKMKSARELAQEVKLREEMYKKEDEELQRKRKIKDRYMMKMLNKYKNTSDVMLVAESALDISQLGLTSAGDIVRNVFRAVFDPKRTYKHLRTYLRDPMRLWKKFKDAADDGAGVATLKRLKMRFRAMSCVKEGITKLEENTVTNFMVHSNDPDPKRRFNPKKPRRRRQDPAFGCSPLMLSLRRRPWLSVYYTCSWFYPHCLSILQLWKQFSDVILFLLAVAVWSPCIIAMELCRAMMCCCLCTG